jgi:hypothetical protein
MAMLALPSVAAAQPSGGGVGATEMASTGSPHQDNILKLLVPVTVTFENQRLDNVMSFIQQYTQVEMEVLWLDDDNTEGLDPEALVSVEADNITALDLLELVLEKAASTDSLSTGNTWQMTKWGTVEVGPRERLNRPAARRVQIYDINDLLLVIPTYDNAPDFDLQSVLQSGGQGGGGGQSPFQQNDEEDIETIPREERAQQIIDLIVQLVETDQWVDNGGEAATINYWQGSLIVRAPDYVHRAIAGYPWWPSARNVSQISQGQGERWVTMSLTTSLAGPYQFRKVPVTAVVPGGGGGGGGGGGSGPPGGGG